MVSVPKIGNQIVQSFLSRNAYAYNERGDKEMVKLFIDPGHGGTDTGAVGNGLREKDLTLAIALRIRDLLEGYQNVDVRLSRENDSTLSLTQRTDMANNWGADYFISIHINAGGGTGFESYIYISASQNSVNYQNIIHAEIMKLLNIVDRGKKSANFHVVRETNMPAILTENGFIDNPQDAERLKQSSFLDLIAQGHVNGLVQVFGLTEITKTIYFYTGGYSGDNLAKIHNFLLDNSWWYKPSRNANNGSMMFTIGAFTTGTENAIKMENFLKVNNYWYMIQDEV